MSSRTLVTVLKKEDARVYFKPAPSSDEWLLLYDFGLNTGDICKVWFVPDVWDNSHKEVLSTYIKCIGVA